MPTPGRASPSFAAKIQYGRLCSGKPQAAWLAESIQLVRLHSAIEKRSVNRRSCFARLCCHFDYSAPLKFFFKLCQHS